jgi:hypothetical protein
MATKKVTPTGVTLFKCFSKVKARSPCLHQEVHPALPALALPSR